jgi:CheY-like chemotaxis protein
VPRDSGESRHSARWSEPPSVGDPHRDVTGALHDVSNALTVLLGWVAEVRTGRGPSEHVERALSIIEERARAARDLARRAIGAQAVVDEREEAVGKVVGDVVETLAVESERAGVRVLVRSRAGDARVPLPGDVSQILTNIVLNALAWAPRGSEVTVDVDPEDSGVAISVQDDGPGVPVGDVPFVFDGASSREGGAGIGLRHARAVARAAGGELDLVPGESAARGACFRLRWPRAEPARLRPSLAPPRPAALAGTRVLVVEDDADVAALLESALGARGAHVVVAHSVQELALHAAETHDAALVDLSPIAHDVRGAVDALRRGSPGVALVFISGSAVGLPDELQEDRVRWVRKPFEIGEIVAAIAESCAATGLERRRDPT